MTPMDDDQALTPAPNMLALEETSPQVGEVLAERYRLEEHIGNDMLGRQLWRGSDVILQRPVTVVLRYPGGDSAAEMLSAAVTASRIVHPHLIGVYDAIGKRREEALPLACAIRLGDSAGAVSAARALGRRKIASRSDLLRALALGRTQHYWR